MAIGESESLDDDEEEDDDMGLEPCISGSSSMVASRNFVDASPRLPLTFGAEHTVFFTMVSMSSRGM